MELKQIDAFRWELPRQGAMRVPGKIFANSAMLKGGKQSEPLKQVSNVATLPGIVKASLAMPDMHWGYGFPIGGVAAFDWQEGVISPGGVGYDINCGVRLATSSLMEYEVRPRLEELVNDSLFHAAPRFPWPGLQPTSAQRSLSRGPRQWSFAPGIGSPAPSPLAIQPHHPTGSGLGTRGRSGSD